MKVQMLALLLAVLALGAVAEADDSLSSCIGDLEQAYTNFKIPDSIESYIGEVKKANPQLNLLSEAAKLGAKPTGNRPRECRDLIEDTMEILIGVPCYYTFANPNHPQFNAYREAKAKSATLERAFGATAVCAL